jgi:ADP-ribose pyrophosphatase YjhB (NUDIX family)
LPCRQRGLAGWKQENDRYVTHQNGASAVLASDAKPDAWRSGHHSSRRERGSACTSHLCTRMALPRRRGGTARKLRTALRRELFEESGIEIRGKPRLHGIFSNFTRSTGDHIAVYVVRDWKRVCEPASRLEIIERKFFERHRVPDGLIEGAKRRLAEVFDQQPIGDTW